MICGVYVIFVSFQEEYKLYNMIKSRLNLLSTFARISTVKSVFSDLQKVCEKSRPFEVTACNSN